MTKFEITIYDYDNKKFIYIVEANSMFSATSKAYDLHKNNGIIRVETKEIR